MKKLIQIKRLMLAILLMAYATFANAGLIVEYTAEIEETGQDTFEGLFREGNIISGRFEINNALSGGNLSSQPNTLNFQPSEQGFLTSSISTVPAGLPGLSSAPGPTIANPFGEDVFRAEFNFIESLDSFVHLFTIRDRVDSGTDNSFVEHFIEFSFFDVLGTFSSLEDIANSNATITDFANNTDDFRFRISTQFTSVLAEGRLTSVTFSNSNASAIPEPHIVGIVGLALVCLFLSRRKNMILFN